MKQPGIRGSSAMITAERLMMEENIHVWKALYHFSSPLERDRSEGPSVRFLTSSVATYLAPIARLPCARGRLVPLTDGIAVVSRQLRGTFELLRWRTTVAGGLPFLWIGVHLPLSGICRGWQLCGCRKRLHADDPGLLGRRPTG